MIKVKKRLVVITILWLLLIGANIYLKLIPIHFRFTKDDVSDICLLTYNVHSEAEDFERYASDMANGILAKSPDFIFLTEYERTANDTIRNRLSKHYTYMVEKFRKGAFEGDSFYSKWEIDSVMKLPLPWYYSSAYRVQIHKATDTLAIYCCHLSSNNLKLNEGRWASLQEGRRLRNMETDTLVAALQKERYPTIVMGDMNDVSFSPAVEKIRSAGLNDAWWDGGLGYGSTYHEGWLRLRIDHILYNTQRMKLKHVDVIGETEWSDHRAVVAGFDLK